VIDAAEFAGITDEDIEAAAKHPKQNAKVLRTYVGRPLRPGHRRIVFRFATSPIEIRGEGRVEEIVLGRNELVTDDQGWVSARDTGEREVLATQLVVRSVGYRGVPIAGLPFDERSGTIPHTAGRVEGSDNEYVVGWIKRGPSGVIGSNKSDSQATVDTLAADLAARVAETGLPERDADHEVQLHRWLLSRQPHLVTAEHWQLIDAHERSIGEPHGRPRVKLASVEEMLQVGHGPSAQESCAECDAVELTSREVPLPESQPQ
jgi:ferredoxin--NADP+ reductase